MKALKLTIKMLGIFIGIAILAFFALFYYATQMSCHEDENPSLTDQQKAEITRLASFIDQYSPDDESYWARGEAAKQLSRVTGRDSDFYQDQARLASAWSYVFYGMSYVPMCYHATSSDDLKKLSNNIVELGSARHYSEKELVGFQLKAMKALAYFHHAQGVEDGYKAMMEMITKTENKNKDLSVRRQLMNNQILFYKLIVQDIVSMNGCIDEDVLKEVKVAADSIDSNSINDDGALIKMSEIDYRKLLSSMIRANSKITKVFNNGISQTVENPKKQDRINSKDASIP